MHIALRVRNKFITRGAKFVKALGDFSVTMTRRAAPVRLSRSFIVISAVFLPRLRTGTAEAKESAFRWVDRHFPDAIYNPETGQWWVRDDDGSMHLFSIERNATT